LAGTDNLECGDLSPLLVRGGLTPPTSANCYSHLVATGRDLTKR